MNILSPSILSADFWRLGEQIEEVERAGARYLHIDVMDGIFVPSISFGLPILHSIRRKTDLFLDVHLMIECPERYIQEFAASGADLINVHLEASKDVAGTLKAIRDCNKKAALTIKPETSVDDLIPYLDQIDMVLVMTVEPGFGGQQLIRPCLDKVRQLRKLIKERNLKIDIEVDGGVNQDNMEEIIQAGANVIVAGSAVFVGDISANIKKLQEQMGIQ